MLGKVSEKNGVTHQVCDYFGQKKSPNPLDSKRFGVKVDFCRDEEDDLVHSSRKQAHKALTNVEYIVPI